MDKRKRPAQIVVLLFIIAAASWRVATLVKKTTRSGGGDKTPLAAGTPAPDFTLPGLKSGRVSLKDLLRKKGAFLWFYDPG